MNMINIFWNPQINIIYKSLFGGSVVIAFLCGLHNVFGKSLPPGPGYRLVETTEKISANHGATTIKFQSF